LAVIVISFYLAVMKKGIENLIQAIAPGEYENYLIDLWKRAEHKVGRWLQGQLLLALIVGLVVYVGLSLMGIKYALLWGLLAMVFEIVPVVGPVLAAIPPVIFGSRSLDNRFLCPCPTTRKSYSCADRYRKNNRS
jgi:predicted PurR-regulated permease PerM